MIVTTLGRLLALTGVFIATANTVLATANTVLAGPAWIESARQEQYLISAEELSQRGSEFHIVDIRSQAQYNAGHIAGAHWVNAGAWLQKAAESKGLLDESFWLEEMRAAGIQNDKPTIVVGDSVPSNSRVWWLLKYLGVQDALLLDGGLSEWTRAGKSLVQSATPTQPSEFKVQFQRERVAFLDDVREDSLKARACHVIDNRSADEFSGVRKSAAKAGHMPGANHLEWTQFLAKDGKFLSPKEIQRKLKDASIPLDEELVTHCQTGGRSSVAAFALEMAGVAQVRNYYAGWSEYGNAEETSVER